MPVTGYEQNRGTPSRTSQAVTDAKEMVAGAQHRAQEIVDERPISTALAVFGAGLGVGVMIGMALADVRPAHRTNNSMEAFGQRMLDSIATVVPDAVSQRFHR